MHVDGAFVDIDRLAPDIVEQLAAREHASGMAHHEFQQPEFRRPELDLVLLAVDPMRFAVEHDVADLQHAGQHFGLGAPEQRLHPRHEFRRRERLDQIIVGAGGKAAHAVAFLAARRQHDDRQPLRFRPHPKPPAKFDAGNRRHHPVEHQQVGRVLLQPDFGLVAARHDLDLVAFGFEIVAKQHAERLLVLDHHDFRRDHCSLLSSASRYPPTLPEPRSSSRPASDGTAGNCSPVTT